MLPIAFCSENCGQSDTIFQYIVVTVVDRFWYYRPYRNGVLYKYARRNASRCEWEPHLGVQYPWDIQRLSRYPEGWDFIFGEPVAGKWTYRFSLDDFLPVPILGGWSFDFDRFDSSTTDPNHNCSVEQILVNYVPLQNPFGVTVTPIMDLPPPPNFRLHTTPCFCREDCYLERRPSQKYLVTSNTIGNPRYATGGVLFEIDVHRPDDCIWFPAVPSAGATQERLERFSTTIPFVDHGFEWHFHYANSPIPPLDLWWEGRWMDDAPDIEGYRGLCDQPTYVIRDITNEQALLTPVPHWVCTDEEARLWVLGQS